MGIPRFWRYFEDKGPVSFNLNQFYPHPGLLPEGEGDKRKIQVNDTKVSLEL